MIPSQIHHPYEEYFEDDEEIQIMNKIFINKYFI